MPILHFLVPGSLETRTGGFIYDRRMVAGLRARGWRVSVHDLGSGYPHPGPGQLAHARRVLEWLPANARVLVDGLALGAIPELARTAAARLRLLALVHHPLAAETGPGAAERHRLFCSERQALAAAAGVIVTSPATARALAEYQVAPERIRVVIPGTDPAPLAAPAPAGAPRLLCVATLTPRKGHGILFEALASLRDRPWALTCIGSQHRSPETTASLRRQLRDSGLAERVELVDELPPAALADYFERADVFVLPSFLEGYGMVLSEALARGLPVISTTAGAIPETVPATAGLLVPPGDAPALAAALLRFLDDAPLRDALRAGARQARTSLPTWEDAARRFATAITDLSGP